MHHTGSVLFTLRILKNVIALIIAAAVCAGVLIYALGEKKRADGGGASVGQGGKVYINEFMASNSGFLPDDTGECSDWIELYNPNDYPVSLRGLGLSNEKNSVKWFFPNVSLDAKGYIIVHASGKGKTDGSFHASFKLPAIEGGIYLSDSAGSIIDWVEYKDQSKNISMGRTVGNPDEWMLFDKPTPGFANDEGGFNAFEKSRYADETPIIITEVLASNKITIADNKGQYSDYIEIYNKGDKPINLEGYGLSDDLFKLLMWKFPDVTIKPGQHLLVFASGKGVVDTDLEEGYIHTNFKVAAYKETIVLSDPMGTILDWVTVSESQSDISYSRILSGEDSYSDEWEESSRTTPGYPNTQQGYEQFIADNPIASGPVIINEVMASNSEYLKEEGSAYDWIELYNKGNEAVNLSGYGLTDKPGNPAKWKMPDVTIAPGEYKIVLASGLDVKKNYIHTNFKLSASGDVLALFDNDGVLQDKYIVEPVPHGVSIGRTQGKDGVFYFEKPTPGAANSAPSEGVVSMPMPDIQSGGYGSAQQIKLSCPTQGAVIRYTTDGTVPNANSPEYTAPVSVKSTGMVRAKAFKDNYISSATSTSSYFIGTKHSLPLVSVVTDPKLLFDPVTGIYEKGPNAVEIPGSTGHFTGANYKKKGRESEVPASIEVYGEDGKRVFVQDVSIRIQGGYSRDHAQKSFAVYARSQYGKNRMEYAFFDDLPYTEYKSLVLRQGGQDQKVAKIKEVVILDLVKDMGFNFLTQALKPYVLYLNGQYWGVYFLMEKRNEYFIAQHENFDDPKSMNIGWSSGQIRHGSNKSHLELMKYVNSHDMSAKENYDYLAKRLDVDSFMDLMISQIFIANSDYGNILYYQLLPDGKWKQIFYDFCWTLGDGTFPDGNHPTLAKRRESNKAGSDYFNALLKYKPWRDKFIERFAWALKEVYNTERVLSYIEKWYDIVKDEMPAEREKFNLSLQGWERQVDNMRRFAKLRPANIVKQLKESFTLSSEQIRMLENAIK